MKVKDLKHGDFFRCNGEVYLYTSLCIYHASNGFKVIQLWIDQEVIKLPQPEFKRTFQEIKNGEYFEIDGKKFRKLKHVVRGDGYSMYNALDMNSYDLIQIVDTKQVDDEIPF